jgi:protein-disulfide isomerase
VTRSFTATRLLIRRHSASLALLLSALACQPSSSGLKRAIDENPEVVFSLIEKYPERFFAAVDKGGAIVKEKELRAQFEPEMLRIKAELKKPAAYEVSSERVVGNRAALITIVEYSDYSCGHCATTYKTMKALQERYGDKIRFVFKHLAILSPRSRSAAEFTEALRLQDPSLAYRFRQELYENQSAFVEQGEDYIRKVLSLIGADTRKADLDRSSGVVQASLESDIAEARQLDLTGTPGFLVNGAVVRGAHPQQVFEWIVEEILEGSRREGSSPVR